MRRYKANEQADLNGMLSMDLPADTADAGAAWEADANAGRVATYRRLIDSTNVGGVNVPAQALLSQGDWQFRAGSNGSGYTTWRQGINSDGNVSFVETTLHQSWDDTFARWQKNVEDYVVNRVDDMASQPGSEITGLAALTYGTRKVGADGVNMLLGIPRLLTSDTIVPGMANAIMHPMDTASSFKAHFSQMSSQDKGVFVAEALMMGGGDAIAGAAGKLPGAGKYLRGTLGYEGGVTLTVDGTKYGFTAGPEVKSTGFGGYQRGAVSGFSFGPIGDVPESAGSAIRRLATEGDKQFPTAGDALAEALVRHGIDPSTVEITTMYGKNPNLLGPQGQPWEMVRGLNSDGELIQFEHHANGHFFGDTNEFELPHYHGPDGEHLTYPGGEYVDY